MDSDTEATSNQAQGIGSNQSNTIATIASDLSEMAKLKPEVLQTLLEPCDRTTDGERLREGSEKLGVSIRAGQRS